MMTSNKLDRRRLVLVVEDQEINRDILGMILEDDYEVIYAENGVEALAQIERNLQTLSIVLLDLMMPVMDGFEVLRRVRADERTCRIPVIVLTAEKEAELEALQLGAADFITKPFDMQEVILARVGRIIELSEGRRLIRAAERDPLTGLYNKGFFFEYAEQILRYHPDWRMDALALNIERFRAVNDLNGREYGDETLKRLAKQISSFLSGAKGIATRVEADSFFLFCKQREDYAAVLAQLQEGVNAEDRSSGLRLRMGVAPQTEGMTLQTQFDRAKTACGMIRGSYQTPLMVYDEAMREKELFQQRLIADVRRAAEEGQLVVYYQPKYNIQCDPPRLSSAEALIRWRHPELGMIPPGEFIPLFESNGLIRIVDGFVWAEAARQVAAWREAFGVTLPVSVNLSRVELLDPPLEGTLCGLIDKNELDPKELKLEVTESACAEDAQELIAVLERLRGRGFEIEMDDFGSGYSSLNSLSTLPIDVLKMDMKFLQNVRAGSREFRLVELILDVAKYLGVPVVAEGVETPEQVELLRGAGCELVQGYYFSRPLPAEEFEKLIVKELRKEETT